MLKGLGLDTWGSETPAVPIVLGSKELVYRFWQALLEKGIFTVGSTMLTALLFGGRTATLFEGRVTQFGLTSEIYRRPIDITTARVFSDPPINTTPVTKVGDQILVGGTIRLPAGKAAAGIRDGQYTVGIRPHHITPVAQGGGASLEGRVLVAELSGSESVIHFDLNGNTFVSQSPGIHPFEVGSVAKMHVDVDSFFFFDGEGRLVAGGP